MMEMIFPLESFSIITGVPSALADVIVTEEEEEEDEDVEEDEEEELVPLELLVSVVSLPVVRVLSRMLVSVSLLIEEEEEDMAFSFLLPSMISPG
ncbi:hypothetical protein [Acetobacter peroxydans]|uniref:Uncharacterized protein n=1 Tax=Acetobacter peroxydans TaxID=104098 RepID=A0A4Y3TWI8_9PROT|nr:hypothetical protein [Acetobacter peroxydans]NHO17027.1 hypothetical protein [Acetobacter peroxydans]GBR33937.1 hypothetical protein AA13755_0695 [Acetobacter peroxydans NBRC 13755]GBR44948.1 hypothetical protein AA0475_2336 [Acetobacter peroxydans]GEB86068.1 hypothetical protein APE01nite_18650 [Acetobacter peroxydans]